jgi:hypothetical protein
MTVLFQPMYNHIDRKNMTIVSNHLRSDTKHAPRSKNQPIIDLCEVEETTTLPLIQSKSMQLKSKTRRKRASQERDSSSEVVIP